MAGFDGSQLDRTPPFGDAPKGGPWRRACLVRPGVAVVAERYERHKRIMDVALVLLLLPFVLIVMGVCAATIWLIDGRPLLFAQPRTGRGGRRFHIYKFRTMVIDAPALKSRYTHLNRLSGPDFKISADPRVTRLGRFLRKSSLDELPQVFNVLKGDMSLVGPRPTSFEASTYSLWHTERLEVKPGLTGLWQISGRSDVDFDQRVRLDVEYIENRSLGTDLRILLQTPRALMQRNGAY